MVTQSDRDEVHPSQTNESHQSSRDEREPTFSSEGDLRSRDSSRQDGTPGSKHSLIPSPGQLATAFSSPAPSITFTPTPNIQLRPRARFAAIQNIPTSTTPQEDPYVSESEEVEEEYQHGEHEYEQEYDVPLPPQTPIPATPYTQSHKRSFLLSVINSTARPRIKFQPTPHPHRVGVDDSASPQENDETIEQEQELEPATPGTLLRPTAFAGVTPRPRGPETVRVWDSVV